MSSYLEEQSFFYKTFLHKDVKENTISKTHMAVKLSGRFYSALHMFAYFLQGI